MHCNATQRNDIHSSDQADKVSYNRVLARRGQYPHNLLLLIAPSPLWLLCPLLSPPLLPRATRGESRSKPRKLRCSAAPECVFCLRARKPSASAVSGVRLSTRPIAPAFLGAAVRLVRRSLDRENGQPQPQPTFSRWHIGLYPVRRAVQSRLTAPSDQPTSGTYMDR